MSRVRSVTRIRLDQHNVDDVAADHSTLLGDVARHDHQHHAWDRLRRVWTVARTRRPGLPAPGRGVALLEALEGGRGQSGAQVILLPPLGAPPVDVSAAAVHQVTDDESAPTRGI